MFVSIVIMSRKDIRHCVRVVKETDSNLEYDLICSTLWAQVRILPVSNFLSFAYNTFSVFYLCEVICTCSSSGNKFRGNRSTQVYAFVRCLIGQVFAIIFSACFHGMGNGPHAKRYTVLSVLISLVRK